MRLKVSESSNLREGWNDNEISISQLQEIVDKIEELIEAMDDVGQEYVSASPNTYRMYNFIGTNNGFINLDDIYSYIKDGDDDLEEDITREGYDNPFTNAKQRKAFDDACDCIHNGYGKIYWKKNYRNGLDISQVDDVWNKAYSYMNESLDEARKKSDGNTTSTNFINNEDSIANIFLRNKEKFNSANSSEEIISIVKELLSENNIDTPASRKILYNLESMKSYNRALTYIWNIILKASGVGVIQSGLNRCESFSIGNTTYRLVRTESKKLQIVEEVNKIEG